MSTQERDLGYNYHAAMAASGARDQAENVYSLSDWRQSGETAASPRAWNVELSDATQQKNILDRQGASMSEPTREEMESHIALAEARTDVKIVRLEGRLETMQAILSGKMDAISEKISADHAYNRSTRWVMVALAAALGGLMVAMATYGDALFVRGMNVQEVIQNTIEKTLFQQSQPPRK
jgi:hypothetical protein